MEEITDEVFRQLLTVVSQWYDQRGYINMLKVLYRDLLKNNYELNKATNVMDLMTLLITSGDLHATYCNILYDTINVTQQYGLEREIKDKLPVFQNVRDVVISKFTHHRRKVMKLGMVLIDDEVKKISALYNKKVKEYSDTWSLIMDLEHNRIICEGKMDAFIAELNNLKLQHAVEALTEEIPKVSSNSGHGYCEEIAVKLIQKRKRESSESEGQPHAKYALSLLKELEQHKDTLTLKDKPEFFDKFKELINYYKEHGLNLTKVEKGSIVFYLSTKDPEALMHLWEIHSSGKLIKDLAQILVPGQHQQEFVDEWMTYIDENEYNAVLSKLKGKERDQQKCSVCIKEGQTKFYCQDCRLYLCSTCSTQHTGYSHFANQKLHLVEDVQSMSPSQMTLLHPPLCSHHSKPLEFYCTDCKTPICVNCTIMDHKEWEEKHKAISISDAFQIFKETSAALEKFAHHFINKLEDGLKAVIQNAILLEQSKNTSLRDIDKHVAEMFEIIKENRDKMKNKIKTIYKIKKKVNDVQIDELKTKISHINTKLSSLNQLLKSDEGTAVQSSERVITELMDRINELPKTEPADNGQIYFFCNNQQMTSLKQCDIGTVTQFSAPHYLTLKRESKPPVKIIKTGEREILEQSPIIIKKDRKLVNSIQINTTGIRDVVKCEDDCLLVSCSTNEILKYKQSGEYISKITLTKGVKVDRMFQMKSGNIAFSDLNFQFIKICNMNGQVIKTIGEGVLTSSYGIHVDKTSNVLYVASWKSSCVLIFDINNGQNIKKIGSKGTKEGQIFRVIDVTLTKQGNLLVLEQYKGRLQLFDNEGRFMKVLVEAGNENGKVMFPSAVLVDEDDNIIISSDHKLQLFSRNGNFIKRIDKPEDGIKYPRGISIISFQPRRLAVANEGDETVKIFSY